MIVMKDNLSAAIMKLCQVSRFHRDNSDLVSTTVYTTGQKWYKDARLKAEKKIRYC